jgi:hypothetical protein
MPTILTRGKILNFQNNYLTLKYIHNYVLLLVNKMRIVAKPAIHNNYAENISLIDVMFLIKFYKFDPKKP